MKYIYFTLSKLHNLFQSLFFPFNLLNIDKCQVISFTRKHRLIRYGYKSDNNLIERVEPVRYRGILFKKNENVTKTAFRNLGESLVIIILASFPVASILEPRVRIPTFSSPLCPVFDTLGSETISTHVTLHDIKLALLEFLPSPAEAAWHPLASWRHILKMVYYAYVRSILEDGSLV